VRSDRRLLGWGLFFIIVGAIPLLVRAGYLNVDQVRTWPTLWPILLIAWGLGLLLRRTPGEVLANALSVVVLGLMGGGLIATGFGGVPSFGACGNGNGGSGFANSSGTVAGLGHVPVRVSVEFNCGTLDIGAIDGSAWTIAGTGPQARGPHIEADRERVRIAHAEDDDFMGFGDSGSAWMIKLPRTPLIDLGITVNAGEGAVDLTGANLGGTSLTLNAGSITLDLAGAAALSSVNATINAGSATFDLPGSVTDVNLTLNAGSVEMCVPAGRHLSVSWSGALGSNNFDELGLEKVDDQHWITPGVESTIEGPLPFVISANAGSFELTIGGSCDA
jgi:hypothetical protein